MRSIEGIGASPRPGPLPAVKGLFDRHTCSTMWRPSQHHLDFNNGPDKLRRMVPGRARATKVFAWAVARIPTPVWWRFHGHHPAQRWWRKSAAACPTASSSRPPRPATLRRLHPRRAHRTRPLTTSPLGPSAPMMGSAASSSWTRQLHGGYRQILPEFIVDESCGNAPLAHRHQAPAGPAELNLRGQRRAGGPGHPGRELASNQAGPPCAAPWGRPPPTRCSPPSTLPDEYEAHVYEKALPAGVCKALIRYVWTHHSARLYPLWPGAVPPGPSRGPSGPPTHKSGKCIKCGACIDQCRF